MPKGSGLITICPLPPPPIQLNYSDKQHLWKLSSLLPYSQNHIKLCLLMRSRTPAQFWHAAFFIVAITMAAISGLSLTTRVNNSGSDDRKLSLWTKIKINKQGVLLHSVDHPQVWLLSKFEDSTFWFILRNWAKHNWKIIFFWVQSNMKHMSQPNMHYCIPLIFPRCYCVASLKTLSLLFLTS